MPKEDVISPTYEKVRFDSLPNSVKCRGCGKSYFAASLKIHKRSCEHEKKRLIDLKNKQEEPMVSKVHAPKEKKTVSSVSFEIREDDLGRICCGFCGRFFSKDRHVQHQTICGRLRQARSDLKPSRVYDSQKARMDGINAPDAPISYLFNVSVSRPGSRARKREHNHSTFRQSKSSHGRQYKNKQHSQQRPFTADDKRSMIQKTESLKDSNNKDQYIHNNEVVENDKMNAHIQHHNQNKLKDAHRYFIGKKNNGQKFKINNHIKSTSNFNSKNLKQSKSWNDLAQAQKKQSNKIFDCNQHPSKQFHTCNNDDDDDDDELKINEDGKTYTDSSSSYLKPNWNEMIQIDYLKINQTEEDIYNDKIVTTNNIPLNQNHQPHENHSQISNHIKLTSEKNQIHSLPNGSSLSVLNNSLHRSDDREPIPSNTSMEKRENTLDTSILLNIKNDSNLLIEQNNHLKNNNKNLTKIISNDTCKQKQQQNVMKNKKKNCLVDKRNQNNLQSFDSKPIKSTTLSSNDDDDVVITSMSTNIVKNQNIKKNRSKNHKIIKLSSINSTTSCQKKKNITNVLVEEFGNHSSNLTSPVSMTNQYHGSFQNRNRIRTTKEKNVDKCCLIPNVSQIHNQLETGKQSSSPPILYQQQTNNIIEIEHDWDSLLIPQALQDIPKPNMHYRSNGLSHNYQMNESSLKKHVRASGHTNYRVQSSSSKERYLTSVSTPVYEHSKNDVLASPYSPPALSPLSPSSKPYHGFPLSNSDWHGATVVANTSSLLQRKSSLSARAATSSNLASCGDQFTPWKEDNIVGSPLSPYSHHSGGWKIAE